MAIRKLVARALAENPRRMPADPWCACLTADDRAVDKLCKESLAPAPGEIQIFQQTSPNLIPSGYQQLCRP